MTSGPIVAAIALSQVGLVEEATGKNDGAPAILYVPDEQEGLAWCAHFVRWCFETAGWPLPGNRWSLGAVHMMEEIFESHGWLLRPTIVPRPGDVVFFKARGESDPGKGRHVGVVVGFDARTATITTVEGNVRNRVELLKHHLGSDRITGFGRRA